MKRLYLTTFVLLIQFWSTLGEKTGQELPCQLVWVAAESPVVVPVNVVRVEPDGNNNHYIVRGKFINDNNYVVGQYYDEDVGELFLPFFGDKDENSTISSDFEFLTNPHECTVSWTDKYQGEDPSFLVPCDRDNPARNEKVGRYFDTNTRLWFPGHANLNEQTIYVALNEGLEGTDEFYNFNVLTSFSAGIQMEVVDFVFDNDPFEGKTDFAGMDEIHNRGPGEVSVTLNHRKTIKETHTVVITKTWTSTYTETIITRIWWFWFWRVSTYTYSKTETEVQTYITEEQNEFVVTQNVVVPAYTSVQACSLIKLTDNQEVNYNATTRYSAKGMEPSDVLAVLKKDNIDAIIIDGEVRGRTPMSGTFKGTMAMNTEFRVVPIDSGFDGCTAQALQSTLLK